jgi:hypothetical protein
LMVLVLRFWMLIAIAIYRSWICKKNWFRNSSFEECAFVVNVVVRVGVVFVCLFVCFYLILIRWEDGRSFCRRRLKCWTSQLSSGKF